MYRTLALAAVVGAIALPAAATTMVKVNIAGLDAKAAHTTIVKGAVTACRAELRDASTFQQYYQLPDCIRSAVTRAEASVETAKPLASAEPATLAGR